METPAQRRAKLNYRKRSRKQIVVEISAKEWEVIDIWCKENNVGKSTIIKRLLFPVVGLSLDDDTPMPDQTYTD